MLFVFGSAATTAATQPPHGWRDWAVLLAGAMALGVVAAEIVPAPPDPDPGTPHPPSPWPGRIRALVRFLAKLVVVVLVGIGVAMGIGWTRGLLRGCTTPTEVPVVAGPESFKTAARLGRSYELATAREHKDCPIIRLSVYAADPTMVRRGLTSSWRVLDTGTRQFDYLRDLGPRPLLWMPDSTLDVDRLTRDLDRNGAPSPLGRPEVYSGSPLSLVVRADSAELPTAGSWLGVIGTYDRNGYAVIRPDPKTSVNGELSLTATYPPGTGRLTAQDLKGPRQAEALITAGRQRAGYPLGNAATLLRQYQSNECAAPEQVALMLPEQFASQPQLAGPGLRADLGCPAKPHRFRSFVPPDSPMQSHPVVPLLWEDRDRTEAASRGVADFIDWLSSEAGRTAIEAVGLRPGDQRSPAARDPKRTTKGLDPALLEQVDRALEQYTKLSGPIHLLLAIDTSGSMATRFDLATTVLDGTAERLGDSDLLGLLTFGGDGVKLAVDPGTAGPRIAGRTGEGPRAGTREQVRSELIRLQPKGGTPLLQGLQRGVTALAGSAGSSVTDPIKALVVVTDGRDSIGGAKITTVAELAEDKRVRVYAVATGQADCSQPALDSITRRSGGACLVASGGPEAVADQLAGAIWAGTAN